MPLRLPRRNPLRVVFSAPKDAYLITVTDPKADDSLQSFYLLGTHLLKKMKLKGRRATVRQSGDRIEFEAVISAWPQVTARELIERTWETRPEHAMKNWLSPDAKSFGVVRVTIAPRFPSGIDDYIYIDLIGTDIWAAEERPLLGDRDEK